MKNYNFDELTERRGTHCVKWDSDNDSELIPMWIADMDFKTVPEVTEALIKRAQSGIFGYVKVPDSYYQAVIDWFHDRHDWNIDRNRIIYTTGVVPALTTIIKALVAPGEGVIFQTPAYNCFFSSTLKNGATQLMNPLKRIETKDGFTYEIDFEQLEELASRNDAKLMILCNPHNPTGRVWTRNELEKIRDICHKYGVRILADEIHCELVHTGYKYIPFATIDPEAIVCCSSSKTFNTAGLQVANIICPDQVTQERISKTLTDNEICDVNPFGIEALQAAYNYGGEWLDSLNLYLTENYNYLRKRLKDAFPDIKICDSESTYLSWVDIRSFGPTSMELEKQLCEKAKVRINSGKMYGDEDYIRINYACPRRRLEEALDRIIRALR